MSDTNVPAMSVIVVTPDCYETVRKTVRHLKAQNVKGRLEIVFVAPSAVNSASIHVRYRGFYNIGSSKLV